jgi:hypothetical protein
MPTTKPGERWYHKAWFVLLMAITALELTTLLRKREGETLSSYVITKSKNPALHGAVGALLVWLLYHWQVAPMMYGSTTLSWRDAVSALAGLALGIGTSLGARRLKHA